MKKPWLLSFASTFIKVNCRQPLEEIFWLFQMNCTYIWFLIRQYPYNSHIFSVMIYTSWWFPVLISTHSYCVIVLVINLSLHFISPLGRFPEGFLRERTSCTGVLYATPFHSLSYLSLPLYISPSTFLSLSLHLSLFSLSFYLAYLMDVFVHGF